MQGGSLCWDEIRERTYIHYCEVDGVSKLSPLQFPSCNHRITTTELLIDCSEGLDLRRNEQGEGTGAASGRVSRELESSLDS